ncbi:hypothetical protein FRC96_02960 [Lujinxingia vulgaris]|uniref:Uncharacterized protein n=1 Tax=Lujinxingia vulgaris TaxID=2600176 RepID=A0A5C6XL15_9DELT|nr:hypothetical protein FRC96_02960 [Lujinxingia vulgaris]
MSTSPKRPRSARRRPKRLARRSRPRRPRWRPRSSRSRRRSRSKRLTSMLWKSARSPHPTRPAGRPSVGSGSLRPARSWSFSTTPRAILR